MKLKFWGTRGSVPVPGKNTLKYGGNTPCVEIRSDKDKLLILDAGTGIRELGNYLSSVNYSDEIKIFLSHYHWDHIQGMPFFMPLYDKSKTVSIYGLNSEEKDVKTILSNQMIPNHFPLSISDFKAKLDFTMIEPGKKYSLNEFTLETFQVVHSSPTLTFKIKCNNRCIVYMTDNEINLESLLKDNTDQEFFNNNKELIDFCHGCDYLIHDTTYDEASVFEKKGWGHSGNISVARFSIIAKVKNLVLFHYNPEYTDEKIDELLFETRKVFSEKNSSIECIAAREGLEISF